MSFLNPISLPVKRYSSTDEGAPQVTYNNQHRAYLKNILKACLVTGYGSKSGAGWAMENEDEINADFIAPDVSMHDHRLLLKTTKSSNIQIACRAGSLTTATISGALPHSNNSYFEGRGWDLLVCDKGFYLLEHYYQKNFKITVSRMLYFGQVKSGIEDGGINCAVYFQGGLDNNIHRFFEDNTQGKQILLKQQYTCSLSCSIFRSSLNTVATNMRVYDHVYVNNRQQVIARQPGLVARTANTVNELSLNEEAQDGKPYLFFSLIYLFNTDNSANLGLRLDEWEY